MRHGAKIKRCSIEVCTKYAHYRHGAKRYTCSNEGCTNNVVKGGVCIRHGAKVINAAVVTDALKLRKWECVEVMGHIASHRMNLQRFHYQMDQHSMKQPELFPPARKRSFNHANNLPRQHKLGQIVPSPPWIKFIPFSDPRA